VTPPDPAQSAPQTCIAGGGPAGVMLGYLLARAGISVVILEKHRDFFRDFRGDTVHPSTLQLMHELGILDEFLKRPHQKVAHLGGYISGRRVEIADFSHLPVACPYIALMPQWDFLDFLAGEGGKYPGFDLRMEQEVTGLIVEGGTVRGAIANGREIRAPLTIGADGRHSSVREAAGLDVIDDGAPIDVLWMRLSRKPGDPEDTLGYFNHGHALVAINRDAYWQCAFVIPKGAFDAIRARGLGELRREMTAAAPWLAGRLEEIAGWDDVKLLSVAVDHLRKWARPGLLCIGDAAHAMSPIGGVGINLAIQDAVAAANILIPALRGGGEAGLDVLEKVQKRREFPVRAIQKIQVFMHRHVFRPVTEGREIRGVPLPVRLANRFPALRRLPARLVGLGIRPEHIRPL
jgi:2-polyprenyl-6-methoxyphenol hydroxylase-like FAD-dependent oxidoreductase